MSDPLSVAASVAGLISLGASMVMTLYSIASVMKDAPQLAKAAADELRNITMVLQKLHQYISGKARASIQRLSLITVEHITATLTSCVLTYSELDVVLRSLHVDTGLRAWDRGMWYLKKEKINEIVQRLQNHKSSLALMLNILQWQVFPRSRPQRASLSEAESSMDRLCDMVNEVLRSNQDLSMRLRNMEQAQRKTSDKDEPTATSPVWGNADDTAGPASPHSSEDAGMPGVGDEAQHATIRRAIPRKPVSVKAIAGDRDGTASLGVEDVHPDPLGDEEKPRETAFEELLHRSRVYRHVERDDDSLSLISAERSSLALSICSSLTLGEISNIALFAIPVYANEISNADHYDFNSQPSSIGEGSSDAPTTPNKSPAPERRQRTAVRDWWRKSLRPPKVNASTVKPQETGPPIFGVPMEISIRYSNVAISLFNEEGQSYIYGYIPIVVGKCGVYLKEKGTEEQYIFEKTGSPKSIQELQVAFDRPPKYGKGLDWTGYTVYDAASVLLRYLLQLPEPLIPKEFRSRFLDPLKGHQTQAVGEFEAQRRDIGGFDIMEAIQAYQTLFTELRPLSRQALLYLMDLLAVFANKSDLNKMHTSKLAALFHSAFLGTPSPDTEEESRLSQDVLIFLLENQDNFLIGMTGTAVDADTVRQMGRTAPAKAPDVASTSETPKVRRASA